MNYKVIRILSNLLWRYKDIDEKKTGSQIQKGTKWNYGLSKRELDSFELDLGFKLSSEIRSYYGNMNGLNNSAVKFLTKNDSRKYESIYFSYPKDIERIKELIKRAKDDNVSDEYVELIPILANKYIVNKEGGSEILSLHPGDNILYSNSLNNFLASELFGKDNKIKNYDPASFSPWLNSEII